MNLYLFIKTLHIVSATIVFGTGIGIANFVLFGHRSRLAQERSFAMRMTVTADFLFTLPAVIIQPLSGAWLVWHGGFVWNDYWLALRYGLYLLAGACWVPVVIMWHDKTARVNFTPAQEPLGQALYTHYGVAMDESYLLIADGHAFTASRGYLELCQILGGCWRILRVTAIIPKRLRDWLKADYCALLTAAQRSRLL